MNNKDLDVTLMLYSKDEGDNLIYNVEIEEKNNEKFFFFSSENYFQALVVAKRVFDKLSKWDDQFKDIGVMIEAHQGRGVSFDINNFTFDNDFDDQESFYKDLVSEYESVRVNDVINNNQVFRNLVRQHKLNEYQEQRLLNYIKESDK